MDHLYIWGQPRFQEKPMNTGQEVGLAGAIKHFFGLSNQETMAEYKKLTEEERAYFRVELTRAGYKIRDTNETPSVATTSIMQPKNEPEAGYAVGDIHPTAAEAV
jgi:hypothetical protein